MLGQEMSINPCLLDYYDKPAEVTQFKIIGENHDNCLIHGSEYASVSLHSAILVPNNSFIVLVSILLFQH